MLVSFAIKFYVKVLWKQKIVKERWFLLGLRRRTSSRWCVTMSLRFHVRMNSRKTLYFFYFFCVSPTLLHIG